MIEFTSLSDFQITDRENWEHWIKKVVASHNAKTGDISYLFCDDKYLLKVNKEFLNHDTLTDIITFDYSMGKTISADILISTERVKENAQIFNEHFNTELHRVMIHGVLHCLGFGDKTEQEAKKMRLLEDKALQLIEKQ